MSQRFQFPLPIAQRRATEFSQLRQRAGLRLDEAARLLAVSERTIYRYESGDARPTRLAFRTLQIAIGERLAGGSVEAEAGSMFRFIDLFAGIGGLRIGFEIIGGPSVFTPY
jgi:DNA (cytosine-5)-methyltransferase 1